MSGKQLITRELADSIRHCLGRKVKLSLKVIVKAEIKQDKYENRILGFSTCRLFILAVKNPTRVEQHFHYLDIQAIESKAANQLCLTVCDKSYTFCTYQEDTASSHEVDTMILNLFTALKNIFPSVPIKHIIRRIDVQPPNRLQQLEELERATAGGVRDLGACGGFSDQYACMCDYHALPYRAEVAWDVDTICLSHDTRELYLHDFDYLEPKDLIPIISALEYNTWFRKFRASHSKLTHEAIERILHVIGKSISLEEIYIDNVSAKAEFANKLSLSLMSNSNLPIQKLDISHNPLEDKGNFLLEEGNRHNQPHSWFLALLDDLFKGWSGWQP